MDQQVILLGKSVAAQTTDVWTLLQRTDTHVSHPSHHCIIITYIYHALINALNAHMILHECHSDEGVYMCIEYHTLVNMYINLSTIFYTPVYTLTRMAFTWHSWRRGSSDGRVGLKVGCNTDTG